MRATLDNLQRANVNVYAIDPSGVTGDGIMGPTKDWLRIFSEDTGGRATMNTNTPWEAVPQIFRENGSYYVLGFRSTNGTTNGAFRRVEVKVNRRDAEVRARSGYLAADGGGDAPPRSAFGRQSDDRDRDTSARLRLRRVPKTSVHAAGRQVLAARRPDGSSRSALAPQSSSRQLRNPRGRDIGRTRWQRDGARRCPRLPEREAVGVGTCPRRHRSRRHSREADHGGHPAARAGAGDRHDSRCLEQDTTRPDTVGRARAVQRKPFNGLPRDQRDNDREERRDLHAEQPRESLVELVVERVHACFEPIHTCHQTRVKIPHDINKM